MSSCTEVPDSMRRRERSESESQGSRRKKIPKTNRNSSTTPDQPRTAYELFRLLALSPQDFSNDIASEERWRQVSPGGRPKYDELAREESERHKGDMRRCSEGVVKLYQGQARKASEGTMEGHPEEDRIESSLEPSASLLDDTAALAPRVSPPLGVPSSQDQEGPTAVCPSSPPFSQQPSAPFGQPAHHDPLQQALLSVGVQTPARRLSVPHHRLPPSSRPPPLASLRTTTCFSRHSCQLEHKHLSHTRLCPQGRLLLRRLSADRWSRVETMA